MPKPLRRKPVPSPEKRIAALERANAALVARLDALETALIVSRNGQVRIESAVGIKLVAPQIDVLASAQLNATAGAIADISAGMVKLNAGMVNASGIVKCDTLQANTVIATTYTPGAGNIW